MIMWSYMVTILAPAADFVKSANVSDKCMHMYSYCTCSIQWQVEQVDGYFLLLCI